MNVKCVLNKKIKVQKLLRTCFKKKTPLFCQLEKIILTFKYQNGSQIFLNIASEKKT